MSDAKLKRLDDSVAQDKALVASQKCADCGAQAEVRFFDCVYRCRACDELENERYFEWLESVVEKPGRLLKWIRKLKRTTNNG